MARRRKPKKQASKRRAHGGKRAKPIKSKKKSAVARKPRRKIRKARRSDPPRRKIKKRGLPGAKGRQSQKGRGSAKPRRRTKRSPRLRSIVEHGPAAVEITIPLYSGPRDWKAYQPGKVVAAGVAAVRDAGAWIRSQGRVAGWEGRVACRVIWSNFMRDSQSQNKRGDWQGMSESQGRSTAYTGWVNVERLARGFFEDSAEGTRLRGDGSQYRLMVLSVSVYAVRE